MTTEKKCINCKKEKLKIDFHLWKNLKLNSKYRHCCVCSCFFFYLNQSEIPLSERIIALISTNDEFLEFKVESMFNTINENYL